MKLPADVLIIILHQVSEQDLIQCQKVDKLWYLCSQFIISCIERRLNREITKSNVIQLFEHICSTNKYISFDYIEYLTSTHLHRLNISCYDLWWAGYLKSIETNNSLLIKRLKEYGVPYSTQHYDKALEKAVSCDNEKVVNDLVHDHVYNPYTCLRIVNIARQKGNTDIVRILESNI